jgi:predicted RecB family nuclease
MSIEVTSELVEAYSHCPRKAFLMLRGEAESVPHEYERILKERAEKNRLRFIETIVDSGESSCEGRPARAGPTVTNGELTAKCDALSKSTPESPRGRACYEPYLATGTHITTKEQKLRLAFAGYVLGETKGSRPTKGFLVTVTNQKKQVRIERLYPTVRSIVNGVRDSIDQSVTDEPAVILNKHCPICQFRQHCRQKAEEEDNLCTPE